MTTSIIFMRKRVSRSNLISFVDFTTKFNMILTFAGITLNFRACGRRRKQRRLLLHRCVQRQEVGWTRLCWSRPAAGEGAVRVGVVSRRRRRRHLKDIIVTNCLCCVQHLFLYIVVDCFHSVTRSAVELHRELCVGWLSPESTSAYDM